MLKGGLTIPFGVFKGKAKGKRYKKSTFANTVVSELDEMDLSSGRAAGETSAPEPRREIVTRIGCAQGERGVKLCNHSLKPLIPFPPPAAESFTGPSHETECVSSFDCCITISVLNETCRNSRGDH